MAYALTLLLAALTLIQPGIIIPGFAAARPFFSVAAITLVAWMLGGKQQQGISYRPIQVYLVMGFVFAETLSVAQFLWIPLIVDVAMRWLKIALVFYLVASQINTLKRLFAFWSVMSLALAWVAGQATWVYHTQAIPHPQLMNGGRLSSYGAYSGANDLALLTVITWPIVFKLMDLIKNPFVRYLPIPLLIVLAYVNIRTISRGGMLAMAVVIGLSMLRGRALGRMGRWGLIVPAVFALLLVGSKVLMTRDDAQDFTGRDESFQHRLEAWYAGLQMFQSSPLYGVGSDNFPRMTKSFGRRKPIQAHNTIIKVGAETGLIGLTCYLGLIFFSFRSIWWVYRRASKIKPDGDEVLWAEALGISLLGFFIQTQLSVKEHEWLLYMVLASIVSLERITRKETALFVLKVQAGSRLLGKVGTKSA